MSDRRLAGKRIIVTGAAQGLGRAFVLHLVGLGARVLAADVREEGLAATCERADGEALAVVADVSSPDSAEALAAAAAQAFGGLDALVNNAAVVEGLVRRPFDEIDPAEWDRVLGVNLKGAWLCARATAPLLRDGGGAIVNLASEAAFTGSPGLAHYVASKAGVIGLTHALARELGPDGVRVNAIAPGFIATEGTRDLAPAGGYDAGATPLGRVGQPDDLLGTLTFLVSDESGFVSGQTLLVNGGRVLD